MELIAGSGKVAKALRAAGVTEVRSHPAGGQQGASVGQAEGGSRGKRKAPEVPKMREYHARGSCVRGLACKLAHGDDELKAFKARLESDPSLGAPRAGAASSAASNPQPGAQVEDPDGDRGGPDHWSSSSGRDDQDHIRGL